jgi:hypothetical protein
MAGQGTLVAAALFAGIVLAWISSYFGPQQGQVTQGKMFEYHADPSKGIVIEQQDVQGYRHITVLTQTAAPEDGSATITIHGQSQGGGNREIGRIDTAAHMWSRWEQDNSSGHLTLSIATGADAHPATQVDLLVFLSSE